jgi:CheY-like chemotaxis protein
VSLLILVVDDEPDVETLFRQQFRRDLRAGRFEMRFAQSAEEALRRIAEAEGASLILILSDINMPGMSGLELLRKPGPPGGMFRSSCSRRMVTRTPSARRSRPAPRPC